MSEVLQPRQELWFDGPNYTADAIIVDPEHEKILLIERRDCGQWALPGGFVDSDETPDAAAVREAAEEVSVAITDGQLVFRGVVDDPRNSQRAWIETSAYLFTHADTTAMQAGDDARDARWFPLADLPPLYASHRAIVRRAVDQLVSKKYLSLPEHLAMHAIDGGHMDYGKYLVDTGTSSVFLKTHERPDAEPEHLTYLRKEAATMSHLRTADYTYLPHMSHLADERTLVTEALAPHDGWHWRAPHDAFDTYVRDCLTAFAVLEQQPLPADTHDVPASYAIHHDEGWYTIADNVLYTLSPLVQQLRPYTQATAQRLSRDFTGLQSTAQALSLPDSFVFCHHDARQANIAWHPERGARLVDWAWADVGRPGSDATMLLIDLHKHGHDISSYLHEVNPEHCLTLIGFWLEHASWPAREADSSVRKQQLLSALAAYEVLEALGSGV